MAGAVAMLNVLLMLLMLLMLFKRGDAVAVVGVACRCLVAGRAVPALYALLRRWRVAWPVGSVVLNVEISTQRKT